MNVKKYIVYIYMNTSYEQKYLKYKEKYLSLKTKLQGGSSKVLSVRERIKNYENARSLEQNKTPVFREVVKLFDKNECKENLKEANKKILENNSNVYEDLKNLTELDKLIINALYDLFLLGPNEININSSGKNISLDEIKLNDFVKWNNLNYNFISNSTQSDNYDDKIKEIKDKLKNLKKKDNLIKLMAIICKHECNKETNRDYLKNNCQLACFGDTFKKLSSLDNKVHKVLKLYMSSRVETNCNEKTNFVADMIKNGPSKIHMIKKSDQSKKGNICNEGKDISIPNMSSVAKLRNINEENLDDLKNELIENKIDTLCNLIKLLKNIFPNWLLQLDLTLMYVMIYDNIKQGSNNDNYFDEFKNNDNKELKLNINQISKSDFNKIIKENFDSNEKVFVNFSGSESK
tara:strand:+ start:842 stop:2056 length:1215 start_codon:yes stop_codon:yes gene_type:complete